MRTIRIQESTDRRILGAIRFVDNASEAVITDSLSLVSKQRMSFVRNLSNNYVITAAVGFEDYVGTFQEAPKYVEAGTKEFTVEVTDPSGWYLPRKFSLKLPRNPDKDKKDSVFSPHDVKLYRSPTAACCAAWSMMRVTVVWDSASEEPVRGAILTLSGTTGDFNGQILAESISDERGEALLMAPQVPTLTFEQPDVVGDTDVGDGNGDDTLESAEPDVIAAEIDARLEVKGVRHNPKEFVWPLDPDNLEWEDADIKEALESVKLKAGREASLTVTLVKP